MDFAQQVALLAVVFAAGVLAGWFFACVMRPRRGGMAAEKAGMAAPREEATAPSRRRVVLLQERAARAAAEAREAYARYAA